MWSLLGLGAVLILTPGPDAVLTFRNSLVAGRRAGIATATGVALGQLVWTLLVAVGLAVVVSAPLLRVLSVLGGLYLVGLGVLVQLAARRNAATVRPICPHGPAFVQGLVSNLLNPKMIGLFVVALPPLVSSSAGLAVFGIAFATATLAWLSVVAVAASRADVSGRFRRLLLGVASVVLVGLGLHLAITGATRP